MLYLDYAASTPLAPGVQEAYLNALEKCYANASANHRLGREGRDRVEKIREEFRKFLGLKKIVFTSSATEATNLFIKGLQNLKGKKVFYSPADHPSLVKTLEFAAKERGWLLQSIPFTDGNICCEQFLSQVDEDTALIALTHVNNHVGLVCPVKEIVHQIKQRFPGVLFFVDCAQSFGKISVGESFLGADAVVISGHKFGAPKGMGILALREEISLTPLLHGGGQENGLRSSSVNWPVLEASLVAANWSLNSNLGAADWKKELESCPGIELPFTHRQCSPFIYFIRTIGLSADIVQRHLEERGIVVSTGAACSKREKKVQPHFEELGLPLENHSQFLRISFDQRLKFEDWKYFCETLGTIMEELKYFRA